MSLVWRTVNQRSFARARGDDAVSEHPSVALRAPLSREASAGSLDPHGGSDDGSLPDLETERRCRTRTRRDQFLGSHAPELTADGIHPMRDGVHPMADGMSLALRTMNPICDGIHPMAHGMSLAWRTMNPIHDGIHPMLHGMSLVWRTMNSIRDRIHSIGRGIRAAGVKSTDSAATTAMAAPVENAAACETRS